MRRVLTRVIADAVVVAIVLFVAAGTVAWGRAWVLLAVLLVVRLLGAIAVFRVNPALLRERATVLIHRDQPWTDRLILLAFMGTAFNGHTAVAALDVFHWQVLPRPPLILASLGLVLFSLGWVIITLALKANAFAVTVVRLQNERQHTVVDTGLYSMVRDPMYAGNPLVLVGLSLWLGSYATALRSDSTWTAHRADRDRGALSAARIAWLSRVRGARAFSGRPWHLVKTSSLLTCRVRIRESPTRQG